MGGSTHLCCRPPRMNRRGDYRLLTLSRRRSSFAPKTRRPVGPTLLFGAATFLASQAPLLHRQASAFALARVQVHLVQSICLPFVYGNTKFNLLQVLFTIPAQDATLRCHILFRLVKTSVFQIHRQQNRHLLRTSAPFVHCFHRHLAICSWSVEMPSRPEHRDL
jgi:hypothetical protein